jgi:hypothetical protein
MQERLLPGRIVHFAQDQVYWECRELLIGEDGAMPPPSRLCKLRELLYENQMMIRERKSRTNSGGEVLKSYPRIWFANIWSELIEAYSKMDLTVPNDKIPAVQGLANRIKNRTRLAFVSGIPFDDSRIALRALLWRRCSEEYLLQPCTWRAPSWSWASLDGAVVYQYKKIYDDDDRVRSLEHSVLRPLARLVQLPDEELPSCPLIISAPIVAAQSIEGYSSHVDPTFGIPWRSWYKKIVVSSCTTGLFTLWFDIENEQPSRFYIAALFFEEKDRCSGFYGIILAKQENTASCERYRRIGLAFISERPKDLLNASIIHLV